MNSHGQVVGKCFFDEYRRHFINVQIAGLFGCNHAINVPPEVFKFNNIIKMLKYFGISCLNLCTTYCASKSIFCATFLTNIPIGLTIWLSENLTHFDSFQNLPTKGTEMEIKDGTSNNHDHLLVLASLFESDFSIDWMVELSQRKASYVILGLEVGVQQGLLMRKEPGVYCFKNLKKRVSLQDKLTANEREHLHKRIVEILISENSQEDSIACAIASHLIHIHNDLDKCRWLGKAGDIHYKAHRTEDALHCYLKVINDLSFLSGREAEELFIKTAIQYSKTSTMSKHETTKVLSFLQNALTKAIKYDNKSLQALIEMHIAKNEWLCSQYINALEHFERGWAIAKKIDDPKFQRSAVTFRTFFLYWQGFFRKAIHIYEKYVPVVEQFPRGRFPLLAAGVIGRCYVQIGQITQGLGMLDAIRTLCLERGDQYLAADLGVTIAAAMLDIRSLDHALMHLHYSSEVAKKEHIDWIEVRGSLMLSYAYFLKGDKIGSLNYLREFLQISKQAQISVRNFPYLMDLCWAIEQGILPRIHGISLSDEVERMIRGKNVFMKGVAYRYKFLIQKRKGHSIDLALKSLNLSLRYLEESGAQLELAKSLQELSCLNLEKGDKEKAKDIAYRSSKILSIFNDEFISDDLRPLIKDKLFEDNLLKKILKLSQEFATIRDNKDLLQQVITTANMITGAERGAIFLIEGNENPPRLILRASKNLTSELISHPSFDTSMKMIEGVSISGKGRILGLTEGNGSQSLSPDIIRSRICVPMTLKEKVVGVLYHDNRILQNIFKEPDLELLGYFATQAALALDNAKAYEEVQRLNQKLKEEKLYYEEEHLQNLCFEDIIGESDAIKKVFEKVDQVAKADTNVLILGETGVGKELVARAIHRYSFRSKKPFIRVFSSALPESLIPSELFGHEKGAFTGAIQRRIGRFELANGGTLFLDEIGDLNLDIQVRLLQVLQSKEFERVGGSETIHSDFRLIAATNRDLEQAVDTGKFRSDLYYRLNVFPIYVPPLRDRKEDIPLLAHYFLKNYATKMTKSFEGISKSEIEKLIQYNWPGNVRELENIIERGIILSHSPHFKVPELGTNHPDHVQLKIDNTLNENERRHILWALQKTRWKVRGLGGAAELLEIHPSTLAFRMKKLGIQRPVEFSRKGRKTLGPKMFNSPAKLH